ncbi:RNA polymerase sigma factor [Anaerobaca lacustris]|uniref:Sigma-70 family RNA polymerase sigma factor n=1 Tax=Anaerobaca lacustris TaxID=3044600 RepID=A0AAW6U417_9BACT|nr:sigma-70 family RNA polymerase sigma factor [Sedimentisphaerales bacterium M17dextr]
MQANYIELVEKARRGDRQSLNQLAAVARERLRVYVYRLTLKEDLTQEIVQESLLEMCRVLGKLKQTDRFWSWLYGIATNKLHRHHRTERALKKAAASEERRRGPLRERQGGLENLVSQELKQIVSKAMQKLRTRHKAVLVMRCYDGMSYAEIADSMGCSEFSTRMLFVRAKKSLQKELSRNGFGKGSLLAALVVFGKMTAPSEAAAAQLTIPVAATQVGVLAGLAGMATTKTAIVTAAAVGAVAIGTATTTSYLGQDARVDNPPVVATVGGHVATPLGAPSAAHEKFWYFFPEGPDGPVMLRAELRGAAGTASQQQRLQDDRANYCYQDDSVSINNHRMWLSDLSVMRLPTDSRAMTSFLSRFDGKLNDVQPVSGRGRGLLVIVERQEQDGQVRATRPLTVRHSNVLEEDYFQSDWSAGTTMVDNRDAMHAREWTYLRIHGRISGRDVAGSGRIPFTYAASREQGPWLRLTVADGTTLVDGPSGAIVQDPNGSATARYPQGTFLRGMNRPWMGLHVMDTVRRDAAEQRAAFRTELMGNGRDVRVTVVHEKMELIYTIDLEADLIRRIELLNAGTPAGHLDFEYLQDLGGDLDEFDAPARTSERTSLRQSEGLLWLVQLANGALGR